MDHEEEYHDPDYAGTSSSIKEETTTLTENDKVEKIRNVVRREFNRELEVRENEIMLIDQRMCTSRRMLHRLRYVLVDNYFHEQKLQLTAGKVESEVAMQLEPRARAEVAAVLRNDQRRLHPSVRKLLGKDTTDLDEIFRNRGPRNKTRKNYSAMVQTRNYTVSGDKARPPAESPEPPEVPEPPPGAAGGSRPRKLPRHIEPKPQNVCTLDAATRNKMKHRYRIIIGNTSKYTPPASRADRATHTWLLYVRGPPARPQLTALLTHVRVRLHPSYAPHHTVLVHKPPFHVCRRGWGEFPALVELHFPLPDRNPPAAVTHTIKLDRDYTGLQTLGGETIVDVWLYSSPEMLKYEFKEEDEETPAEVVPKEPEIKTEVPEEDTEWMNFFNNEPTELDVDAMIIKPNKDNDINTKDVDVNTAKVKEENITDLEPLTESAAQNECTDEEPKQNDSSVKLSYKSLDSPTDIPKELLNQPTSLKKRIMKYIDPTTGKIYYLEVDRNLDLSKWHEIIINNTKIAKLNPIKSNGLKNVRKKKGVSLLKPEVQNLLKNDSNNFNIYSHIENDHCYLASNWKKASDYNETRILEYVEPTIEDTVVKEEESLYDCLCGAVVRLTNVRMAVGYLLKKIPLISDEARDPDFLKYFPFVVENEQKYWKLDIAKRRNIEWSRAKLINKILTNHLVTKEQIWRTKQILVYSRLHGYHELRPEADQPPPETDEWSSWNDLENSRRMESNIRQIYPNAADISSLSVFNSEIYDNSLSESIEVTDSDEEVDIVQCELPVKVKKEINEAPSDCDSGLTVLPVEDEDDRLRFMYIEKKCADIGIELRNEDVGNGYSYSAVHAVVSAATRCYLDDLLRTALAAARRTRTDLPPVWTGCVGRRTAVCLEHVWAAAGAGSGPGSVPGPGAGSGPGSVPGPGAGSGPGSVPGPGPRLRLVSGAGRAAPRRHAHPI